MAQPKVSMRGGTINKPKVDGFIKLMCLLYKFGIISFEELHDLGNWSYHVNPLITANKIFIDKFTN